MDGKRNRRPATANASSGRKSRGSLTSFLDKDLTTKIYGENEKANHSTNESRASSPKSFSPPMLQREPSRRTIRPMSALGALNMTEKKIREECTRNFADHWYLEGSDRFKTSVNHIVRENVFQVDKELISKDFSRPKSASYMSTYRTTVESPSKYPLPSLKPVMVRMSKIEFSEEADLLNIDHIRPGVEKSKYVSLKLSEKTKHAYQQRKEERVLEATKSIQSSQSDKDLWLKRDQQLTEVNANDVLFLECLRKDVLPYPLKGVDKMMRQCVQFDDQHTLSQENRRVASTIPLISTHIEEEESQTTAGMDTDADADPSSTGQPAIHIIKSPNQSVVVPGTSVTDVRASSVLQLDLTERSIGNDRAICLADACQFCPSLQALKIPNNRLNDYACAKLSFALLRRTQLTYLDMSENTLGAHTIELLGTYLANPNAILRHLDIGNCEISDELLGQFGQRLITNHSLVYLSIQNNKLGYRDENHILTFAHVIQQHPALQELNLAGNFIRRTAARDLLRSLQDNRTLTKLNLASNQIQDTSLLDAIAYLEGNHTLTELDLSHNRIESRGCIALSYLASRPTSAFRRLHLMGNAIGEMGYCFAMMMMREVAMTATRSPPSNASSAPAALTAAMSASSRTQSRQRGGGDILENDEEDINEHHSKDPTASQQPEDSTMERLLHIFCEAKKCPEELGGLQFWNAWGKLQVNLQDPYERTVACYLLDRINQHPFATIVDVKYYNPTIKAYEHPMLKRQADILADTSTSTSSATNKASNTTSPPSSLEEVMRSLAHLLGIPALPESVITTAYQHQETLRPWVQDPRYHGRLIVFLLQQVLMVWLNGNSASDVSAHGLLSSLKATATAGTTTATAQQHHQPPPLLSMFPTGSLAGCEITALESINRWLSEGNPYNQGHAIDRLKVIHIMMAQWLSQTIVETATLHHRPPSPYMMYNAGGSFERWQLPTVGSLQWNLRMPESHGIQSFQWTDPSFQVFVRSLHRLPKEHHSIASYFYQVIDIAARTQENVLQATCIQAEWILRHILKRRLTNHIEIIEKLLFQLSTPDETRRFLIRNLYFHEMAYIRKKLGVAFRVLTGNVTGHYILDLSNPLHRFTARKLAAYSNYECVQFPGLLNGRLGQCIVPSRMKTTPTTTGDPSSTTQTRPTTAGGGAPRKRPSAKDTSAAILTTLTTDPRFTVFPKDGGAFHFRNPSYNGTYHPIDAEWILSSTSSMPDVGKIRFDFVSYDPQALFMTPSMEFTGGNRIPITLPITTATEEADRVRRETFVDVLMNHVLQSSELFRYSAKLMEKKKLQPKNYHHHHHYGGQMNKKDSNGGRASLFETSLTSTDPSLPQLQPGEGGHGDEDGDEDGDEEGEEDEEDEEDEGEDDNTSGANDQGSTSTGQALSRASFHGGSSGRMGRATFTKLQDQSEDIDTGVRQAFLRVQQMMAKQQSSLHPVDTLTSGDFMHQLTAASVPSPMANANATTSTTTAAASAAAAGPSRGVIVTNVTKSSNNADAPQQPIPLSQPNANNNNNSSHHDDRPPSSSLRKKKSNKPKIKRLMFRRNHTVYEKMFVAECTDWWRDFLESANLVYVQRQRKHLMKIGAVVYKETLTTRELRALDGTKLERDAYPEEVYASPTYIAAAQIGLYRLIDFPAYASQQQTLKVTISNAANALSIANSQPVALPSSTEMVLPTNGTITMTTPATMVTSAAAAATAAQAISNSATTSTMASSTILRRSRGTMIGGGSFSQSISTPAANGNGGPPASSLAAPDRHEAFIARAIAHCLTFEDAFVALELFLLYNVWLDAFQVGCILRAFEQHFAQHRPQSGATGALAAREDASVTNHSAAGGSYASSSGGGGGNASGPSTIVWTAQSIQELALVRVLSILWPRIVDKGSPVFMTTLQRHFPSTVWETISLEISHRLGWLSLWSPTQPWNGSPYVCDLAQGDQRYLAQQLCALIKDDPQLASLTEWQYQPSRLQAWQPQKPFNTTKPLVESTTVLLSDGPIPVNLWPAVMKWPEKDLYPTAGLIKIIIHPPPSSSAAANSLSTSTTAASATSINSEANWSKRIEIQQRQAFHVVTPVVNQPELAHALHLNASTKG